MMKKTPEELDERRRLAVIARRYGARLRASRARDPLDPARGRYGLELPSTGEAVGFDADGRPSLTAEQVREVLRLIQSDGGSL